MRNERSFVLFLALGPLASPIFSQSRAAFEQLLARHTEDEVRMMREEVHYRYVGELLYFSGSFLVEEELGELRAATETEIATIDLSMHESLRLPDERVGVHDPLINKHVVLLSRDEFEQLVLGQLSEADRAAYLAAKDGSRYSSKIR